MRTAGVGRTHGVNAIMPKVMMQSNKSAADEETADGWISVATSPIVLWLVHKFVTLRQRGGHPALWATDRGSLFPYSFTRSVNSVPCGSPAVSGNVTGLPCSA